MSARPLALAILASLLASAMSAPGATNVERRARADRARPHFQTAQNCMACHNGLTTESGEDVSIGSAWRASMMANSSRDPYWQASVRREAIDHPGATREIEDECATCHMPMSRTAAIAGGRRGEIFAHLPLKRGTSETDRLAADGVSCTLCHQISGERLGTAESFTGGYVVNAARAPADPHIFGPFDIDPGRTSVMRSATGVRPVESSHMSQSELCATCHTLFTAARDATGKIIGRLPEQVPYLEWRHGAVDEEHSCQECHMPAVEPATPIASVLGEPRAALSRHGFLGGNFLMLRMLDRYRGELAVDAPPAELQASAAGTERQLQADTATLELTQAAREGPDLRFEVTLRNLTGHKLPTGYPSRRAWLHVTVHDGAGRRMFESGAITAGGAIEGNDQDAEAASYEPHYEEIHSPGEVQIYESVMVDANGIMTTGLLSGVRFEKDNRLLPRGFDKGAAGPDIAVRGGAASDADFTGGQDRIRFRIAAGSAGPFQIDVELRYQPISFRWAQNLKRYDAVETRRFVKYFEAMADRSSVVLARSSTRIE